MSESPYAIDRGSNWRRKAVEEWLFGLDLVTPETRVHCGGEALHERVHLRAPSLRPIGPHCAKDEVGVGLPGEIPGCRHRRQERQSEQSNCEHSLRLLLKTGPRGRRGPYERPAYHPSVKLKKLVAPRTPRYL